MYYGNTQTVIEGTDVTALRAIAVERQPERTLVHLTLELRPDKLLIAPERAGELQLHLTDGIEHNLLSLEPLPNEEAVTLSPEEISEQAESSASVAKESTPATESEGDADVSNN